MGLLSVAVERLLHTTALPSDAPVPPRARQLHAGTPVVDLVVGSGLFRRSLLDTSGRGHVDLGRLRQGGVNVIGLTIATRYPDLRGTLSRHHFRSLGAPADALHSNMALAEWLIGRVDGWTAASGGAVRLIRSRADLATCLRPGGPVGVFLGVQGGHVLDGETANLARLRERGVRMLAPAHVMDNALVGSGTGRRRGGLSGFGREVVDELERQRMLVDLAHMSLAGMEETLRLVTRPPVLSHTGLLSCSARSSRWRRYTPATRNVPDRLVRLVAAAGGLTGICLSTQLLGGASLEQAVAVFRHATAVAGAAGVGIGSDMDGGLRMLVDAAGLPRLSAAMLAAGTEEGELRAVLGGNALRLLEATFE